MSVMTLGEAMWFALGLFTDAFASGVVLCIALCRMSLERLRMAREEKAERETA